MQDVDQEALWQVTCPCGWRTHGTKAEVVTAVIDHGQSAHDQTLTEADVMQIAVPLPDSPAP